MKPFSLDLSKFKKVKSDGKSSVLRHEDGHELKIAHANLSPKLKTQLDAIPKFAFGGETEGSDAKDVLPDWANRPLKDQISTAASSEMSTPNIPRDVAEQALADPNSPLAKDHPDELNQAAVAYGLQPQPPAAAPVGDIPPDAAGPAPASMGAPMGMAPPADAPPAANPYDMSALTQSQIGALNEQKAGNQQMAQAQGQAAAAEAQHEQSFQSDIQRRDQIYQSANSDLMQERKALQADIANGHVDPKRYIDSMSTGKHISTAIGLILGGIGAGLTGQPNMAFNYLQSQIDRDIASQKDEMGKKQNLLANNFEQTRDLRSATELSRLHANDILSSQLKMEADKAQDQMTKGRLLDIAGRFDQQSAALQHQLAVQKAMMGPAPGGNQEDSFKQRMQYLRMNGQVALAKDMEAKHVPGVGQASREVPQDVMTQLIARQDLQHKIEDLQAFAKQNSGSLNPAIIQQGSAKAHLLQDAYRRANAQGVFKESEKNFIEGIASSDPTQFFQKYRSGKGYQEMGRDNLSTLNGLKQGYGLPASQPAAAPDPQVYLQWARQNASNPKAKFILQKFGAK